MKRIIQICSTFLIVVTLVTSVGCYGSFKLVTKVYKWNGTIGDKWVNEVAFLALNIVPVYGISAAIDALILNSIEFWTGKNPVNASVDLPDQNAAIALNEDGTLIFRSQEGKTLTIALTEEGAEVRNADGVLMARSVRSEDGVAVYSPEGDILGTMSKEQIAALSPATH
jgi:hypothetical protein